VQQSILPVLRCPACGGTLSLETSETNISHILEGQLLCQCRRSYPISEGIPNLIYPEELSPSDKEFLQQYSKGAEEYDKQIAWLFHSFSADEHTIRAQLTELLQVRSGDRVLEVSCGTGSNLSHILTQIGSNGELFALDLSPGMLNVAKRKLTGSQSPVEFLLGNAAYLPFADGSFDALLHFGGLNTFGEVRRALAEMTRVVRVGGKLVIGDEGLAPWLSETEYGNLLLRTNTLFKHQPPLADLSPHVQDVHLRWFLGNAFYVIDYRVGDKTPELNVARCDMLSR